MYEHPLPNGTKVRVLAHTSNYKLTDCDGYIRMGDAAGYYYVSMLSTAYERDTLGRWYETTTIRVPAEAVEVLHL